MSSSFWMFGIVNLKLFSQSIPSSCVMSLIFSICRSCLLFSTSVSTGIFPGISFHFCLFFGIGNPLFGFQFLLFFCCLPALFKLVIRCLLQTLRTVDFHYRCQIVVSTYDSINFFNSASIFEFSV